MKKCLTMYLITFLILPSLFIYTIPVTNAQTEYATLGERMARIEGILEQMNERMMGLNHLSDRMNTLQNTLNLMWVSLLVAYLASPFISAYAQKRIK